MTQSSVTALLLAAGLSSRMGRPKPLLPFGDHLVVERLLHSLSLCPVRETLVVVGHAREQLEPRLVGWNAQAVYNPHYATGEMLSSLQTGLRAMPLSTQAALVVLVDQPTLEVTVVERLVAAYQAELGTVIVPSYHRRRGHPMLIDRSHWPTILALTEGQTLRDFMRSVGPHIYHVTVDTPSVLRDMDTPADYERELALHLASQPT
jgi:molybdenum cofactor cytidylyltransferase